MAITRFTLPSQNDLVNRYCQDVSRLKRRAGITRPNVAPGSETYIKAEAISAAALQIYAREMALQDAAMPDTATADDLDRSALVWQGLTRSSGAGAAGNVVASCAGVVVYSVGLEATSPDGLRYKVQTTTVANNGDPIPVIGIDTGKRTEKTAGTIMTWTAPPAGSNTTALVDATGLNNGADAEDDAALRKRYQNALRYPASSGSWAHYQSWAMASSIGIEEAWVYPAVRGPATVDVAITVAATADNAYSRHASSTLINAAALAMVTQSPEHADLLTTTVANLPTNLIVKLRLPLPYLDGGAGGGWVDQTAVRWPAVGTTPNFATYVSLAPTTPTVLRVQTWSAPIANAHIAIWSILNKSFVHARILSSSAIGAGVYDLTLYDPIDITAITINDYVSPDAEAIDDYGRVFAEAFATLGPGEKTATVALLPRSLRHPLNTAESPSSLTSANVFAISQLRPEVANMVVVYPTSLPVACAVADPPNILTLGKLAIYQDV